MKMIKILIMSLVLLFIVGCTENVKKILDDNEVDTTTPIAIDGNGTETNVTTDNGSTSVIETNSSPDNDSTSPNETDAGIGNGSTQPIETNETVVTVPRRREAVNQETDDEEEPLGLGVELKPSNWYLRLVAKDVSRKLTTNVAQLGVLEEANAEVKHTLLSTGHFAGAYLDVIFIDPDGMPAGSYKTNYKTYQEGTSYRWRFTVKSDDANADVTLTWRGLNVLTLYTDAQGREQYTEYRSVTNPLIKQMKLVDIDLSTDIVISVEDKAQTYIFNMNGQTERVFEWVVETDIITIVPKESGIIKSKNLKGNVKAFKRVLKNPVPFDITKPPSMEWHHER